MEISGGLPTVLQIHHRRVALKFVAADTSRRKLFANQRPAWLNEPLGRRSARIHIRGYSGSVAADVSRR
jgi:hypothetical protein